MYVCVCVHILLFGQSKDQKLIIWFADNILALNSKKTNFVLFSLSNHKVLNSIKFDLHTVNSVSSVKYLGYFLDSHLKWRQHVINVNDKIAKGLCMLRL